MTLLRRSTATRVSPASGSRTVNLIAEFRRCNVIRCSS